MTHTIDEGLAHRLAVFRIMNTLQKRFLGYGKLDRTQYWAALAHGFTDHNEDNQAKSFGNLTLFFSWFPWPANTEAPPE